MKRISVLLLLMLGLAVMTGCGEDDPVGIPGEPATTLTLQKLGDRSVFLSWEGGDLGEEYVKYLIFNQPSSTDPAFLVPIIETEATEIEITNINGVQLNNGQSYTFHVRTKKVDGLFGDNSTNDITAYPRSEGTGIMIWEFEAPSGGGPSQRI